MKKIASVLVIAVLAAQCTRAAVSQRQRRQAVDPSNNTEIADMMRKGLNLAESLPGIGEMISNAIGLATRLFDVIEFLTNGVVTRFLSRVLPCTIYLDKGIECNGITDDNNLVSLASEILKSLMLPQSIKRLIPFLIGDSIQPLVDLLAGGLLMPRN